MGATASTAAPAGDLRGLAAVLMALATPLSVAAAAAIYRFVERPPELDSAPRGGAGALRGLVARKRAPV